MYSCEFDSFLDGFIQKKIMPKTEMFRTCFPHSYCAEFNSVWPVPFSIMQEDRGIRTPKPLD